MRDPQAVHARDQRSLALWLAMIAGYVDAYAILAYGVYVSFMSGNTTQTGSVIGQEKLLAAVPAALAILFFVVGSTAGTWLTKSGLRQSRHILFAAIAAVFAVIIGGAQLGNRALPADLCISMLGMAMGLMNTTQSHIGGEPMSLTFVTGTLNRIGTHLALALRRAPLPDAQGAWDTHLRRAGLGASVWASFLTGAIMSASASSHFGVWALLAPFFGVLALTLFGCADRDVPTARSQASSRPSM